MNPHLDATLACLDRLLELAKVVCEMISNVETSSAVLLLTLLLSLFARAASSNRQFESMLRSATAAVSTVSARIHRRVMISANGGHEWRVIGVHRTPWWMRLVKDGMTGGELMVLMTSWCRILWRVVVVSVSDT